MAKSSSRRGSRRVALDAKDGLGAVEPGAVEHEANDGTRGVELPQAITVDLVDVGLVEPPEHVGIELAEWRRKQRVEDVDERLVARAVPVVVVARPYSQW